MQSTVSLGRISDQSKPDPILTNMKKYFILAATFETYTVTQVVCNS